MQSAAFSDSEREDSVPVQAQDGLNPQPKKRGRPKKSDLALAFDRASSSSASGPPTPAPHDDDPLAADELALFGVAGTEEVLPDPPKEGNTGFGKRALESGPSAPMGRAKRPKNVKFSPAKAGKTLNRRSIATATKSISGSGEDSSLPNNDFCDACHGKGHFLCCDGGCLRSFHFSCLEPPLDIDDVPDEDWYCKSCRAARNPPRPTYHGYFKELIHRVEIENPKAFTLTPEIKNFFKNVATGPSGEFLDSIEHRPPGRAVGQEDRDGYRLKDKVGRNILCYRCNEAASIQKQRRIISCDFCEQHWHLDCLDPPMTGMPPPTRKWMCPVHSDQILPKKRVPKHTTTITVQEPHTPNNGDVVIVPRREVPRLMDDYEEVTVNRIRYQVPEETIILDFWGRVQETAKARGLRTPSRKQVFDTLTNIAQRGGSSDSEEGGSSLTSLAEESDADPPNYGDYRKQSVPDFIDTSGLDWLAKIAGDVIAQRAAIAELAVDAVQSPPSNGTTPTAGPSNGDSSQLKRKYPWDSEAEPVDALGKKRANRLSLAPTGTPVKFESPAPAELAVQSKEDLKALTHVRKLMAALPSGSNEREAMRGFMDGSPIVLP
ncbi:hypothetical protein MNV49_007686 [Pseudohyphozyma bogoriensis]|nr:hypothetical protein MNV49_007686 [Pseudohyphozyma bogoriensis]